MGILSTALRAPADVRRIEGGRSSPMAEWLTMGTGMSSAGIPVTEEGSLRYAAVFACVRVIAESVAQLPLVVYELLPGRRKEVAYENRLYELLHDAPNPLMDSFMYRETMQGHQLLWGNSYSEIELDGSGLPVALWPLRPDAMEKIESAGEMLVYTYRLPNGKSVTLPGWQVLHLRGLSSNGLVGYSPIQWAARDAIGKGLAIQKYGAAFFRNGARPGGVLSFPGELSPEAAARVRQSWQSHYGGLENAHRVAVLEQGMTYQEVGIHPGDAAYIDDQKMSSLDVARVFRVPPHMIGDLDRATFSNIEHQSIEFVTHSLMPWLKRWEQGLTQQLMSSADRKRFAIKFKVDGLLRGDTLSRFQAYAVARQNGWMSADDIRELEDMNALPDGQGEMYLVPLNMVPAGSVGGQESAPVTSDERRVTNFETRAADRVGLMRAQRPAFEDAIGRVVKRQAQDITAQAKKQLGKRSEGDFRLWLNEFWAQHREWIVKTLLPLYRSYGATAALAAVREIDGEATLADVNTFIEDYVAEFAEYLVWRSGEKVEEALQNEDDPLGALELATGLWLAEWPAALALTETVKAANAVTREVYQKGGVKELIWRTTWGDKSCAYCEGLDGVRVGIEGKFDVPGLPPFRNVAYPPVHDGCECTVEAIPLQ